MPAEALALLLCALAARGCDLVLMSRSGCADSADETDGVGIAGSPLKNADTNGMVKTTFDRLGRTEAEVFGAGRHSEVMKGHDIKAPPPATTASFSHDPGYARDIFDIPWTALQDDYEMLVWHP